MATCRHAVAAATCRHSPGSGGNLPPRTLHRRRLRRHETEDAMNPYDQAHALAKSLKESEEYTEYMRLKQVAYDDSTNKALLDEYKRLQFRMQAKLASGENMPEEDLQRLQQIGALLQFNPDVSAYLMAEFRFQRMLSDIFKILADVAGIDLDMLSQG